MVPKRSPSTMMSSAAVTDSHRTPAGIGAEASRRNTGEPGRSARTISTNGNTPAQGDPPNGEPKVMTVSDQMHLVGTGCTQDRFHLGDQPLSQLLHRRSQRRIAHRFDGQASGIKGVGDQGPTLR
jgi:hypothetical protein